MDSATRATRGLDFSHREKAERRRTHPVPQGIQLTHLAFRAPVERLVGHFKNWKIFHTDYRRPYSTYHDAFDAARGLFFF